MANPLFPNRGLFQAFNNPQLNVYESQDANPKQKWHWNIRVSGRIIAASTEGYENRSDAITNIKNLKNHIQWLENNGKLI